MARIGSVIANSVIDWPSWLLRESLLLIPGSASVVWLRWLNLRRKEGGRALVGRARPVPCRTVLGDVTGDPGHGGNDVAGEDCECAENGDRDHGKDDAVLRHRLPLFPLERVEKLEHLIHLPSSNQASLVARQCMTT